MIAAPLQGDPVAVLGSGTMGVQIALTFALSGHPVRLWGRGEAKLAAALDRVEAGRSQLEGAGLLDGADPPDPLPVTTTTGIADAVAGAGFVIEAVVEDLRAKKAVLAAAEPSVGATTLLSSTTSALSPRAIQSDLKEPQRFVVAHYAQPAHLMRLVEVVPGAETDEAAVKACCDLLEATGKLPVRCPDIPGFLWARIQHAILREFAGLVGRGLTTPEACDLVLKEGYAVRLPAMGSFEHADLAGLDLMNSEASRAVWADLCNAREPDETPVGQLFRQGHRGMSSGHGFYDWTERDAAAFRAARDEVILRRLKESPAR